ncbi:MAG: Asp-tRNA(Asn)/Glu-tRNA(Gln) amidotransferase subunit GatA [Crenarchaeota archaeon]|nr:Asp-tRNA(Asn)/Glu-tRNA(Gln) amidotransferase subunit GatA [Thermoproteota archaeon]
MRLYTLPAWRLRWELVEGGGDPASYVEQVYERIRLFEKTLNSYITLRSMEEVVEEVEQQVREARRGAYKPLAGVLLAVKDNIAVEGLPNTCASRMLSKYIPPYTATVVERLVEAGAVVIGKTNMDEFAMGSTGETSAYGPTRNPWSINRVPGGSSSGTAAAVAAALATIGLGNDTGGSIRLPAAWTGLYGLKSTYGLVSRYGLVSYAESLEQIGPMTRNIMDLAVMMEAMAGFDPRDSTSLDYTPSRGVYTAAVERGEEGARLSVALLEDMVEHEAVSEDVRRVVYRAAEALEEMGAKVSREKVGRHVAYYALPAYYVIAMCEASSNLARYDNIRYGYREPPRPWEGWNTYYSRVRGEGFGREVKRRIMLGSWMLSAGYKDQYYVRALRLRRMVRDRLLSLAERYDVLLLPSAVTMPPRLGEAITDPVKLYMLDTVSVQANLSGLPALTVPAGKVRSIPLGVQLMARPLGEPRLFTAASMIATATGLHDLIAEPVG